MHNPDPDNGNTNPDILLLHVRQLVASRQVLQVISQFAQETLVEL